MFRAALAITAIWLVFWVIYVFLHFDWDCFIHECTAPKRFLRPNELGDFLAGTFAPLAFLWLFVATMLQREELGLQRKELQETREVLALQKAELARAADENREQTTIMKANLLSESEQKVYTEVDIILYSLALYIAANWPNSIIRSRDQQHHRYLINVPAKYTDGISKENFDRSFNSVHNSSRESLNLQGRDFEPVSDECRQFLNYCRDELDRLCGSAKYNENYLSNVRINALQLRETLANINAIKKAFVV